MRWLLLFLLFIPFACAYQGYSDPVSGFSVPASLQFAADEQQRPLAVSVSDDAVYYKGYYSFDDGVWHNFTFPQTASDGWILSDGASKLLVVPRGEGDEYYVIVYSCARSGESWDCHGDRWQIHQFNVTLESSGSAESGLLVGVPLIHDQTFVVPEEALVGDTVGDLNLMWLAPGQDVSFSMVDDDGGRFSVDASGRVSVASASFDYDAQPRRVMRVRATEVASGEYSDALVTVLLSRSEDTVFVDPSWSGCHDGSRSCPFSSWDDVDFQQGMAYLQRRGTVFPDNFWIEADGTADKHLVVGAYGVGKRPDIDCSAVPDAQGIFLGSGYDHGGADAAHFVDVYSFVVHGCNGIRTSYSSTDLIFRDIEIYESGDNGGIYVWQDMTNDVPEDLRVLLEDIESHDNQEIHGIKCQGGGITARNLLLYRNGGHGVSFPYESAFNDVEFVYAYDNGESGVEIGSDDTSLRHALVEQNYHGVWMNDNAPRITVTDVLARDNYAHGFSIEQGVTEVLLEHNVAYGNEGSGIRIRDNASGVVLRNNSLYGNARGLTTSLYEQRAPSHVQVIDNDIEDNSEFGVFIDRGADVLIQGNSFRGNGQAISVGAAASGVVQSGNSFS